MRLFDFLECFDLNIPVLILDENRMAIDENIIGEITQKTMTQREVLKVYHEANKIVVTAMENQWKVRCRGKLNVLLDC